MRLLDLFESEFLTGQEAFQRWFAGSKIVDAAGKPLKLYRGLLGDYVQTADRMEPRKGYAMFFTPSPYVAASYANSDQGPSAIFPVYVKATTLREFPTKMRGGYPSFDMFAFDTVASRLQADQGVVVRGVVDIGPRANSTIDPEKRYSYATDIYAFGKGTSIKSAVSNVGTFDDTNAMSESVGSPMLYHGTSYVGLLAIFTENLLRGYPTDIRLPDGRIDHNGPASVSLTRDIRSARSHAGKDIRKAEGGRVVLVLDRDKLVRRVGRRLRPIDVLGIRGASPDNPFGGVSEFEERVPGDLSNIVGLITRVIIDDPGSFNQFERQTLERRPDLGPAFETIRSLI